MSFDSVLLWFDKLLGIEELILWAYAESKMVWFVAYLAVLSKHVGSYESYALLSMAT